MEIKEMQDNKSMAEKFIQDRLNEFQEETNLEIKSVIISTSPNISKSDKLEYRCNIRVEL